MGNFTGDWRCRTVAVAKHFWLSGKDYPVFLFKIILHAVSSFKEKEKKDKVYKWYIQWPHSASQEMLKDLGEKLNVIMKSNKN